MSDYFKEDGYWKDHINKELEPDIWIRENFLMEKENVWI